MRHVKKILSVILVMAIALTMALPAAAAGNRTLTINSKTSGHTYQAYQVFSGRLDSTGKLLADIDWGANVDTTKEVDGKTVLAAIQGLDGFAQCQTAVQIAEVLGGAGTTAETLDAFAAVVSKYLKGTPGTSEGPAGDAETGYVYTISGLDDGYYFVTEDVQTPETDNSYTKFMLQVIGDTTVDAKTDVPSAVKKVQENSEKYNIDGGYGAGYNDVADYNIGDEVPFEFYSKVPDMSNFKTYKYIFHDSMSAGLDFNNDVEVTIGGATLTQKIGDAAGDYTVTIVDGGFKVEILNLKNIEAAIAGADIYVKFTATLNDDAVIGLDGNPNTLTLEYSNNPNNETQTTTGTSDTVIVFTYELDVTKVDGKDNTPLEGVEFKMRNADGKYVIISTTGDNKGRVTGWADTKEGGSVLTTASGGNFAVIGLDDGVYYLEETRPKDGYNTIKDPIQVTISATTANGQNWTDGTAANALTALNITIGEGDDASMTQGSADTGSVSTIVKNNKGIELPGTGGIGTTIFYIVGGILVVGAAVLLIAKKRTKG